MSVQVCLGEIETWIMEPKENINYLEATFDVKIEMPNVSEVLTKNCSCPSQEHIMILWCAHAAIGHLVNTNVMSALRLGVNHLLPLIIFCARSFRCSRNVTMYREKLKQSSKLEKTKREQSWKYY